MLFPLFFKGDKVFVKTLGVKYEKWTDFEKHTLENKTLLCIPHRVYTTGVRIQIRRLSWSENSIRLTWSCRSMTLSLKEENIKEIHFSFLRILSEQPKLNACLRWWSCTRAGDGDGDGAGGRIHHDWLLFPFFASFLVERIIEMALYSYENSGVKIYSDRKLSVLEYANDVAFLHNDPAKLQALISHLNVSGFVWDVFWLFKNANCRGSGMIQSWSLFLRGRSRVEWKFCYWGSDITSCGGISDGVPSHAQNARLTSTDLRHLWCYRDPR